MIAMYLFYSVFFVVSLARFFLSVYLFMVVVVICFACVFLLAAVQFKSFHICTRMYL